MTKPIEFDSTAFGKAATVLGSQFKSTAGVFMEGAVRGSAKLVRAAVVQRAARHRRTGRLQRNIRVTATGTGWSTAVRVKSGGPIAHLIARGVKPHAITSSTPMPIGGGRFAMSVQHPGFRGDHYFLRGVTDAVPDVNGILRKKGAELPERLKVQMS